MPLNQEINVYGSVEPENGSILPTINEEEAELEPDVIDFGVFLEPPQAQNNVIQGQGLEAQITNNSNIQIIGGPGGGITYQWEPSTISFGSVGNSLSLEDEEFQEIYKRTMRKTDLDLKKKFTKEEGKVTLYEQNIVVNESDAIFFSNIGYFLKNDKRILKDFVTQEDALDDRNYYTLSEVYDIKDDKLVLIGKTNFHSVNDMSEVVYPIKFDITKLVYSDNQTCDAFILVKAFESDYFKNSFYVSPYGIACLKETQYCVTKMKQFRKHKILGIKYKSPKSFLTDTNQLPITFNYTHGKKYSFGVEIETSSGAVPHYMGKGLYFDAVYDGSLKHPDDGNAYGLEYVTDVLVGDRGLQQLRSLCNVLTKTCEINKQCGRMNATLISNN